MGFLKLKGSRRFIVHVLLLAICTTQMTTAARAEPIVEPPVFASSGGALDLLVVAKPAPIGTIAFQPPSSGAPIHPTGWVYEVCPRPSQGDACPAGGATASDYGGVRLSLQRGDTLKIRLVNRLPALDKAKLKHVEESGLGNLFLNPTNLHTHGLIVAPREATSDDPTFGDYVFVELFNPANGRPAAGSHAHAVPRNDFIDYRIDIPRDHPSGLYWFHPHIHGLSLNQVSAGLAGIITIGDVNDYAPAADGDVRHLILKDMQVLAGGQLQYDSGPVTIAPGEVQNQQIAEFCEARSNGGPESRHGYCEGQPNEGSGNSFIGSRWFFTINGQVFPTIQIASPAGEIWRIVNASAQVSYRLHLDDNATGAPISMQLIAVDGAQVVVSPDTPRNTVVSQGGGRFKLVDCPAQQRSAKPVCVTELTMMPSSRAEVWVTYRQPDGSVASQSADGTATLMQDTMDLGQGGEGWPQVRLAAVEFSQAQTSRSAIALASGRVGLKVAAAAPAPTTIMSPALRPACLPLPPGHHRRIFFGLENSTNPKSRFGLGYEEVDQSGKPVPGTQVPIEAFNPARTMVCIPLRAGGAAIHETWELVNLSNETHNFHIHQTKFTVMSTRTASTAGEAAILEDSVPVPYGTISDPALKDRQNGYCTIDQWRAGQCTSKPVIVDIPFTQYGEFVFHCHILEHEDNGMMARIRVMPAP